MVQSTDYAKITKKASRTFYLSSLLFPKKIRSDVFILYSYVRKMDDLIDSSPPDYSLYQTYKKLTLTALQGIKSGVPLIEEFASLMKRKKLPEKWLFSFFNSLELDYKTKQYVHFKDLEEFIYGVAEVIGLMMAQVMDLPIKSHVTARALGKSMQLINILRDISEDKKMGRIYLPQDELKRFEITRIPPISSKEKTQFIKFIQFQFERIHSIQNEAEKGFRYIPNSSLMAVKTASDIYYSLGKKIVKNPLIIFEKKVRPSLMFILFLIIRNYIQVQWGKYHYE